MSNEKRREGSIRQRFFWESRSFLQPRVGLLSARANVSRAGGVSAQPHPHLQVYTSVLSLHVLHFT